MNDSLGSMSTSAGDGQISRPPPCTESGLFYRDVASDLLEPCFGFNSTAMNMDNLIYMDNPRDMLEPAKINPAFVPIVATHMVTFLIGVVGNVIVLLTWAGKGHLRSPTAAFLVSLAVADLLLLVIYFPLETLEYFVITWDNGGSICKMSSYVEMLSGMASVLNLVAVSIERFLVIVYPMKARRLCTVSTSRRGLVVVWTMAIVLALPVLFTKHVYSITYYNNSTSLTAYYCWDTDDEWATAIAIYQLMAMFVVPAVFMVVCYFVVIQELWMSTKTIADMTKATSTTPGTNSKVPVNGTLASAPSSSSLLAATGSVSSSIQRPHQHHRCSTRANKGQGKYSVRWTNRNELSTERSSVSSTTGVEKANGNCPIEVVQSNVVQLGTRTGGLVVSNARKQVIKMLIFVVAIFLLCWGPRLIMNVIIKCGLQSYNQFTYTARVACYLLSFIHSAANPFVYGLMSSNFRRMLCKSCQSATGRAARQARSAGHGGGRRKMEKSDLAIQSFGFGPETSRAANEVNEFEGTGEMTMIAGEGTTTVVAVAMNGRVVCSLKDEQIDVDLGAVSTL